MDRESVGQHGAKGIFSTRQQAVWGVFQKPNKEVPRPSVFCLPQQWLDHGVQLGTSC